MTDIPITVVPGRIDKGEFHGFQVWGTIHIQDTVLDEKLEEVLNQEIEFLKRDFLKEFKQLRENYSLQEGSNG